MAQSITAEKGRLLLIKLSDGTSPTTFVTVTGLRNTKMAINSNPVDTTNKGSQGWRELLPGAGVQSVTVTGDGVFDAGSAQFKALQTATLAPVLVQAEVVMPDGSGFTGTWPVSTLERSGAHNDAEVYSITLESSGPVIYNTIAL